MIIFLNGASSSGKSTIAKALQAICPTPYLTIGIDTFLEMMPPQYVGTGEKAKEGFQFVMESDEEGAITRVVEGDYGTKVCQSAPKVINTLANDGHDLIVDEVLFEDKNLSDYVRVLYQHKVYFIGIHCDLNTLLEREILRGHRMVGMSREQIYRVHGPKRFYDLELNTTSTSAIDCAKRILDFINTTPEPKSFQKLYTAFYG